MNRLARAAGLRWALGAWLCVAVAAQAQTPDPVAPPPPQESVGIVLPDGGGPAAQPSPDQELARAEARYRAAISLDPAVGSYHASLAVVLMRQGRLDEARQAAAASVRYDPTSPRSRAVFGDVLIAQRRWADAESQLEEAIRYGDHDPLRYEALGRAYAGQAKWDLAAAAYREALELVPESLSAQEGYRAALARSAGDVAPLDLELGFETASRSGAGLIRAFRAVSAILLGIAAVGVLYPLVGFLFVVVLLAPRQLLRRSA